MFRVNTLFRVNTSEIYPKPKIDRALASETNRQRSLAVPAWFADYGKSVYLSDVYATKIAAIASIYIKQLEKYIAIPTEL